MARRSTAPSLWLPGFDPDDPEPPTVPEPAAPIVVPTVEAALAGAIKIAAVETPEPTLAARASWRTSSQIVEAGPRLLWPRLTSASRLYPVGAVAKFEANLEAIDTLQRIETENRAASAEERQSLQRYTGWGGLPGSFNLDPVSPQLPTLPQGWEGRLIRIERPPVTALCLEPVDAAISKLARGEPRDLRWVRAGLQAQLISLPMLRLRARSTTFLDAAEQNATLQRLANLGAM